MADVDLTGANGTVTWSGSDGPTVARVSVVRGRIFRRENRTTRPLSVQHRSSYGPWEGGALLRVVITDDGHPPLPTPATQGTLVIKQNNTLQTLTLKGAMTAIGNLGYNALAGDQQFIDYQFNLDGRTTSDIPVVA